MAPLPIDHSLKCRRGSFVVGEPKILSSRAPSRRTIASTSPGASIAAVRDHLLGNECCSHPANHPDADRYAIEAGRDAKNDAARCNQRQAPHVADRTRRADGLRVAGLQFEALGNPGGNCEGPQGAGACIASSFRQRAVGGDTQSEGIAGEQAFDAFGRSAGLVLCAAFQRFIGLPDPGFAEPDQRDADRQQDGGENERAAWPL